MADTSASMQDLTAETQTPMSTDIVIDQEVISAQTTSESKINGSELVKNGESSKPQMSLEDSLLQRVSTIKEGDNVLLRLPSDMVKAVVASEHGYVYTHLSLSRSVRVTVQLTV